MDSIQTSKWPQTSLSAGCRLKSNQTYTVWLAYTSDFGALRVGVPTLPNLPPPPSHALVDVDDVLAVGAAVLYVLARVTKKGIKQHGQQLQRESGQECPLVAWRKQGSLITRG